MQQITVSAIDYKARQYWSVAGVYKREQAERLKRIPNTYFSHSKRCWLIPRNLITKPILESVLSEPSTSHGVMVPDTSVLSRLYCGIWREIAPIDPASLPKYRLPKSTKYQCIVRMLYSHDLSIIQLCRIELAHISWGSGLLEIHIQTPTSSKLALNHVDSKLLTDYIRQSEPEKFLFESQPGCAFPEEKLYRSLASYVPRATKLEHHQ